MTAVKGAVGLNHQGQVTISNGSPVAHAAVYTLIK
jgi:hypothetical protein